MELRNGMKRKETHHYCSARHSSGMIMARIGRPFSAAKLSVEFTLGTQAEKMTNESAPVSRTTQPKYLNYRRKATYFVHRLYLTEAALSEF